MEWCCTRRILLWLIRKRKGSSRVTNSTAGDHRHSRQVWRDALLFPTRPSSASHEYAPPISWTPYGIVLAAMQAVVNCNAIDSNTSSEIRRADQYQRSGFRATAVESDAPSTSMAYNKCPVATRIADRIPGRLSFLIRRKSTRCSCRYMYLPLLATRTQ